MAGKLPRRLQIFSFGGGVAACQFSKLKKATMNYYRDCDNQFYNSCVVGLILVAKYCFRMVIYSPFLVTGYLISRSFLGKSDHAVLWMGMTLLFAYLVYMLLAILKKLMAHWRTENNYWWVAIFIICVSFTCILPVYLVFGPLQTVLCKLSHGSHTKAITWIFSIAFGFYVYHKHRFLKNE
jgi:hypothetical protein